MEYTANSQLSTTAGPEPDRKKKEWTKYCLTVSVFCVSLSAAQVAYFGGVQSSGGHKWSGLYFWLLPVSVLPLVCTRLPNGLL